MPLPPARSWLRGRIGIPRADALPTRLPLRAGRAIGGQTAALACIYLVTSLLSELLTNNAAAAIMYPIASSAADTLGIHPNVMSVAVMLGGSAGWALPYSYQVRAAAVAPCGRPALLA